MQEALGSVPSPTKRKESSYWLCPRNSVNAGKWEEARSGITGSYLYRGVILEVPFVLLSLLNKGGSWQGRSVIKSGRKRNLSPLHLTVFKQGKQADRAMPNNRELGSSRTLAIPSWLVTFNLRKGNGPQYRFQRKLNRPRSVFSFPDTSQPVDPAHTFSSVLHVLQRLLGPRHLPPHRCWPLKTSTKVFRVSRSFVYGWTLHPSTQRKAITNSLS